MQRLQIYRKAQRPRVVALLLGVGLRIHPVQQQPRLLLHRVVQVLAVVVRPYLTLCLVEEDRGLRQPELLVERPLQRW